MMVGWGRKKRPLEPQFIQYIEFRFHKQQKCHPREHMQKYVFFRTCKVETETYNEDN